MQKMNPSRLIIEIKFKSLIIIEGLTFLTWIVNQNSVSLKIKVRIESIFVFVSLEKLVLEFHDDIFHFTNFFSPYFLLFSIFQLTDFQFFPQPSHFSSTFIFRLYRIIDQPLHFWVFFQIFSQILNPFAESLHFVLQVLTFFLCFK